MLRRVNLLTGVINIYKEKGYTSHDVVAILRGKLKEKKIGHTGTLDPEAEGVLPICIGKATKLASLITDGQKQYIANVKFGATTTTQDHTGEILNKYKYLFNKEDVTNVVNSFQGECLQVPPMYSAIRVDGRRLYELAREGKVVERKKRKIHIYNIEIIEWIDNEQITIKVDCSKGTYIRTLCEDIGQKLGYGAYMNGLVRTKSSDFNISDSIKISEIDNFIEQGQINELMIGLDKILEIYPKIYTNDSKDKTVVNGSKITIKDISDNNVNLIDNTIFRVYTSNALFIGLYVVVDNQIGILKPYKMLI